MHQRCSISAASAVSQAPMVQEHWFRALHRQPAAVCGTFISCCVLFITGMLLWMRAQVPEPAGSDLTLLTRTLLPSNGSELGSTLKEPFDEWFDAQYPTWSDEPFVKLKAGSLQWLYRDESQQLQLKSGHHLPLHWVITSCNRENLGRMLSTTLLSGLLNALQPDSISIVWCKPYKADDMPSLFYNLRHSHKVEIIYMAQELPVRTSTTYLMSLLVPRLRNQQDRHLLITEDDVVFAPDVNAKLSELVHKASQKAHGSPYIINLYNPPQEPMATMQAAIAMYNKPLSVPRWLPGGHASKAGAVKQSRFSYWYGTQGALFSPAMTKYLSRHFYQVLTGATNLTQGFCESPPCGQDHIVKDFLIRYECSFKYDPAAHCHVFNVEPSLVQHIGTSSATWAANASSGGKFHLATDFPTKVAFPGLDKPGSW